MIKKAKGYYQEVEQMMVNSDPLHSFYSTIFFKS